MILKSNVASSHIKFCGSSEAAAPGLSPKILLYEEKDEKGAEAIGSHSWDV